MKITIVGCGNSGLIHAAKLIEKGHKVGILKTTDINNEFFNMIKKEGGYHVKDSTNNENRYFVKPSFITKDVQKAIEFAQIIMITTITNQHKNIANLIAPYVSDGQIITLIPGYMGSLIFKKIIKKDVIYSEWETTAYNGRIMDSMYVRITYYNVRNAISVLPNHKTEDVVDIFSKLFSNTQYSRKHILESALHNPNLIVHTVGMLFSASRIEYSKGEFWMYKEAFTDSIINVIKDFDNQKNLILQEFGCHPLNYFEAAKWRNEKNIDKNAMKVFQSFAESSNKGPMVLNHRYLLEDVPMGLCLFSSIGKVLNIETSISDSIITLASSLLQINFENNGRSIYNLLQKENVTKGDIYSAII